jgi:hypothetical protein
LATANTRSCACRRQHLDGHIPLQEQVTTAIHGTHAAMTDLRVEAVAVVEKGADHRLS